MTAAGVVTGAVATGVVGAAAADGAVFTATGALLGCVAATGAEIGAEATGLPATLPASFERLPVIATSVPRIPFNVACTVASCEGVSVVFTASELLNCESVAASALSVDRSAFT